MLSAHTLQVLAARGPRLILEMPGACFLPEHEPYVSAIFRHILEDPVTLQAAMEAEIRNTLSRGQNPDATGAIFSHASTGFQKGCWSFYPGSIWKCDVAAFAGSHHCSASYPDCYTSATSRCKWGVSESTYTSCKLGIDMILQ